MFYRRHFLAGLGTLAASGLSAPARAIAEARLTEVDVVIIGAGAAGIEAAHGLRSAGRNVVVLEARHRIGGRAFTDTSLGPAYDAGAMFIHWAERNPWVQIARDLGIETPNEPRGSGFRVFADGKPMEEADRQRRRGAFGQIDRRLNAAGLSQRDLSIADLLGDLGPDIAPIASSGLLLSIGEEARSISARDYQRLWAGDDLVVPTGYGNLVARHGAGLDIRLGEPVSAIDWTGAGVTITSRSGTLRANACIVTVPVGVLKADAIRFTPALPATNRTALDGIGMGALTKIALRVEGNRFGIPPGASYLEAGSSRRLMNFDLFPDNKDLIVGYCGGDYARELSAAGLEGARDHVVELLVRMLGSDFRKAATGCSFPAWWTDPFARGAYSVCLPGHDGARDALAQPIGGRIFIAGEATAGGGAMTVGGATLAGRAAAAAVARLKS
jgi:monoamine oxidase